MNLPSITNILRRFPYGLDEVKVKELHRTLLETFVVRFGFFFLSLLSLSLTQYFRNWQEELSMFHEKTLLFNRKCISNFRLDDIKNVHESSPMKKGWMGGRGEKKQKNWW